MYGTTYSLRDGCTYLQQIPKSQELPPWIATRTSLSLSRDAFFWECKVFALLIRRGRHLFNNWLRDNAGQLSLFGFLSISHLTSNPQPMKLIHLYRLTLTGLLVCTLSAYGQQGSNNVEQRVDSILSQMTLDEKLSYIGGTGFFDVKPIPVPNLQAQFNPQLFQTDAGLGVRITPASVRYPGGPVLAATWNPDRARDAGAGLGRDTRARGFFTILGPGMDFYRTPFGGRNFEYMTGEDPFLGSQLIPKVIQEDPAARRMGVRKAFCV